MRKQYTAIGLFLIGCAWSALAFGASGEAWHAYMIPGAAHLPGALGTFWQTDVAIMNPYSHKELQITVAFLEELKDNSEQIRRLIRVAPRTQVLLEDVVQTLFGLTAKGALLLWTDKDSYFFVSARTYTGRLQTYGQSINGQAWVQPGNGRAVIQGIRNSGQYRANVGAVNWSDQWLSVRFDAYDANGQLRGSRNFSLPPYGTEQVALSSFAQTFASGYLRLTGLSEDRDGSGWIAYASIVDNSTGDAIFLEEREEDFYSERIPQYNLEGHWTGWLVTSTFNQQIDVNVYQDEALVWCYIYDSETGLRAGWARGYQEGNQLFLSGASNNFYSLGDTFESLALVQQAGASVIGTLSGTGTFSGGGSFSLQKQYSWVNGTLSNQLKEPSVSGQPRRAKRMGRPPQN